MRTALAGGPARRYETALDDRAQHGTVGRRLPPARRTRNQRATQQNQHGAARESQRLQNVLDDFLNFAKVRGIWLEPADLNDEVERMLAFFQPTAQTSKIEILRFFQPDLRTCFWIEF